MVTHDPEVAMNHAKVIYWVKDGKVEKVTKKYQGKWRTI